MASRGERGAGSTDQHAEFFDESRRRHRVFRRSAADITARKRAEMSIGNRSATTDVMVLRAAKCAFRSLADNAPVLIWMSGLRNEAVYFNKPWLDFTGRSLEEELGFGWIESIHPDDRSHASTPATRHSRAGSLWRCNSGSAARWRVPLDPRQRDSVFRGRRCVQRLRRKLRGHHTRKLAEEELEQAGRRKDEFLAMLGHELRNPLAPIGMAVEIMRKRAGRRLDRLGA
jgi:PAS domain-containing protein